MDDFIFEAVKKLQKDRLKVIENYIEFWLAVNVPDAYLTPEYIANNFCLYEDRTNPAEVKIWLDFKDRWPNGEAT